MKEECSICGVAFSRNSLIRCFRCAKLSCRNCVIFSWDKNVYRHTPKCLDCAVRLVSPRRTGRIGTKYNPLGYYLTRRQGHIIYVTLTFSEIEELIEDSLPSSALQNKSWWSNAPSRVQANAWLNSGWIVHDLDLEHETVIFRRTRPPEIGSVRESRRKTTTSAKKSFQPPRPRTYRRRLPSKTRVAMAIARRKNVERRSLSMRKYRGKFKPKSAFEKRLYREEEKPDKQE